MTYLRVSVTDRCDLRCVYCMSEHMTFLPKAQVLSIEELDHLASAFIGLGVRALETAIRLAIDAKPQGHDFHIERGAAPALARHMSTTGG